MKHEPIGDHAERKRILALIEQCGKEQTMKQIKINPNNEPYYSEDFIKGFKCGTQRQLEADKADRPQGKWIDYRPYNIPLFDCSICGYHAKKMSNFCPNCGARMVSK